MKRQLLYTILCLYLFMPLYAAGIFRNPIIPGLNSEPSICRVENDYYLVTSSFEWFPGLPIYHSKDLMNWEQIGHVSPRYSQLDFEKRNSKRSMVLHSPTIRYYKGLFYVVFTNEHVGGDFYVTAKSPTGPWSDPVLIKKDSTGHSSLFFDENGVCWYVSSASITNNETCFSNEGVIHIQRLDLQKKRLVGECRSILIRNTINLSSVEKVHLYKVGKKYLLLLSEVCAQKNYSVTAFMADSVLGPYTPSVANPVLTHNFLGCKTDITNVGYADLVNTPEGKWWSVVSGIRELNEINILGREVFLTPVEFQNGWPVFNPGIGRILSVDKATGIKEYKFPIESTRDDFDTAVLGNCWNFLRNPYTKWFNIAEGKLSLELCSESMKDSLNPSLVARRIQHFSYTALTMMNFIPKQDGEEAGLIVMQSRTKYYCLAKQRYNGKERLLLYKFNKGIRTELASIPYKDNQVYLCIVAQGKNYRFYIGRNSENMKALGEKQEAVIEKENDNIAPFIGMYAYSNGWKSKNKASFEFFDYKAGTAYPLQVKKQSIHDIAIRDPYIFPDRKTNTYYLYCATRLETDRPNGRHGLKMYKSKDFKTWEGPYMVYEATECAWADPLHGIWAPEMHEYEGKYYLFATFTNNKSNLLLQMPGETGIHRRGTVILVSNTPEGPFVPLTGDVHTPVDWSSLDGTLYVENGKPYMVFCHEWSQIIDGTIEFVPLSNDLSIVEGTPITMFRATDASWVKTLEDYKKEKIGRFVTDGCFLHRNQNGKLIMLWSSFGDKGYMVSTAVSESGSIWGPWKHRKLPLFDENGGHAMLFKMFDGRLVMTLHYPNDGKEPHARFFEVKEVDDTLEIVEEIDFN